MLVFSKSTEILESQVPLFSKENVFYLPVSWKSLSNSAKNGVFLVFFQDITTVDAAISLRGIDLLISRDQLSQDPLIEDYIGLVAKEKSSQRLLGKIIAYVNAGGSDYFSIKTSKGSFLLPCAKQYWDPPQGEMAFFIDVEGWITGASAYIDP